MGSLIAAAYLASLTDYPAKAFSLKELQVKKRGAVRQHASTDAPTDALYSMPLSPVSVLAKSHPSLLIIFQLILRIIIAFFDLCKSSSQHD